MRLKRYTEYLLSHFWVALALTFVSTFIPVINVFGILYAALVTLRKGWVAGVIFTAAATIPYAIGFGLNNYHEVTVTMPLAMWAAAGVAILSNVLTWLFAGMLRRQPKWGGILQLAALAGVLVVSVVHLAYPDVANWWGMQLQAFYNHAQSTGLLKNQTPAAIETRMEIIRTTQQYASGVMIAGILFNAILQLIIARWWQLKVFHQAGGLRKELHNIRLYPLAGALFILSLILSYLGNAVVLDIMPILYLLFGVAGLSLIHCLFAQMQSNTKWFWLMIFYLLLIFSLFGSVVLVALVGLADVWLDLRKRLKKSA